MGAPIGVPPITIATRSAVTRPRMPGSVDSCIRLFEVLVMVSEAMPVTTSSIAAKIQKPGESAAQAQPSANIAEPDSRVRRLGCSRPAATKAPAMVPIAMMDDNRPKPLAPAWNTSTAMVEMKIWKFRPKVPIRNSMARIAIRSGRPLT